ncbi:Sirohydrochlorin cobaltochelatase CbiK @ Sirohydrochlorin ferrochelatase activity of CbiK [hydrothermal vent metagenome]|uniref:Sirohydrochlorin cobaltochelatase CbiK @ Sirohydrochlorin ferrochelatase activity of CbiK n=1 Tax=hydrothermal vent metagenome TaxID=652676 RepID=A0A3B1CNQ6_9ZZZZ
MSTRYTVLTVASVTIFMLFAFTGNVFAMLKTMTLKKDPAIVIAAFGTTTRAQATYDFFDEQLKKELPAKYRNYEIRWAFTSEIVRERANKKFEKAGIKKRYLSLAQVVSNLEDEGYRKIVVQPLHIFPGIEYESVLGMVEGLREVFKDFNLRIKTGEPLLQYWWDLEEVAEILKPDLLKSGEGCNVLASHGTGETAVGSNITYLGLERVLSLKYDNTFLGSVEGITSRESALAKAKACKSKTVKFIPFMYVAGDHVMNDIMGSEPEDDGELSWSLEMKKAGFRTEATTINYKGKEYFKGLGFYPEVNRIYIKGIVRLLKKFEF